MAGLREKQIQKRKQETLDAAIRRLTEGGYTNLNMDDLADEVGISKPTLYQDFSSKEELVAQALVRLFEKMEAHLDDEPDLSPLEQIERFLRTMLKSRTEQRNFMNGVDGEVIRNIMRNHPYPMQHMAATWSRLAQVVQKGQELGEIDPDLSPWVVVGMMFSVQGVMRHLAFHEGAQWSEREIDKAIESTIRIFLRGIRVPANTPIPGQQMTGQGSQSP